MKTRIRWTRHAAFMGEKCVCRVSLGNMEERAQLKDPGAGGRIILKWILGTLRGRGLD
jgi:hypothetical protein